MKIFFFIIFMPTLRLMPYFIHNGSSQIGPLTIDELKQHNITASTPVWKEGLSDSGEALHFEELKGILTVTPPVFKTSTPPPSKHATQKPLSAAEKTGYKIGKNVGGFELLIAIVIIGMIIFNRNHHTPPHIPEATFTDPEHDRPQNNHKVTCTYHPNFWGNKEVINGTITNRASHTNYKDIRIRVKFLSLTNTNVQTKEYILYEYVPPTALRKILP